jgi:hypothetical protein
MAPQLDVVSGQEDQLRSCSQNMEGHKVVTNWDGSNLLSLRAGLVRPCLLADQPTQANAVLSERLR